MKLVEIAGRWFVQTSHATVAHPESGPVYDPPQTFSSHNDALQGLIKLMCSIFGEADREWQEEEALSGPTWFQEEAEYWCDVTVDDLKSAKDFGAFYVEKDESGTHWYYSVGSDGDVIVSSGAPFMPNRAEVEREYERAGLIPKSSKPRITH